MTIRSAGHLFDLLFSMRLINKVIPVRKIFKESYLDFFSLILLTIACNSPIVCFLLTKPLATSMSFRRSSSIFSDSSGFSALSSPAFVSMFSPFQSANRHRGAVTAMHSPQGHLGLKRHCSWCEDHASANRKRISLNLANT